MRKLHNLCELQTEIFDEVKRLFLKERLSRREISMRLKDRASYSTISSYIKRVVATCEERGVCIPPRETQIAHTEFPQILR